MATPRSIDCSWYKCTKCNFFVNPRHTIVHIDNCPPNCALEPCISGKTYYTIINKMKTNILKDFKDTFILLPASVMKLLNIAMGDWVMINTPDTISFPKKAWPNEKDSLIPELTKREYDLHWKGLTNIQTSIFKIDLSILIPAASVSFVIRNPPRNLELKGLFVEHFKEEVASKPITKGNLITVKLFGQDQVFEVVDTKDSDIPSIDVTYKQDLDEKYTSVQPFLIIEPFTKIFVFRSIKEFKESVGKKCIWIGGLDAEFNELLKIVKIATDKSLRMPEMIFPKVVLLYGHSGTGKTLITKNVSAYCESPLITITPFDIPKYSEPVEMFVEQKFQEAVDKSPSIMLLDEFDLLCPSRYSRMGEANFKFTNCILKQLDEMSMQDLCVCIIVTSNNPDKIDPAFRRFGRIDREIEIPIPSPVGRYEVLKNLLYKLETEMTNGDIKAVAEKAHGFVGADLASLCSRACMNAITEFRSVNLSDFQFALKEVKPSAMREIAIQVPNVLMSQIGGQEELKMILKQVIEWPLNHADSFTRMGINPPRGVLMYGPPGCSKTMIAKALATESGLNFISVKGPEFFNKYVGESERAVREVFRKAQQVAPAIIFFDEIDALGGERSSSSANGCSVQDRVLTQLLTELDGVTTLEKVMILAATNRPDRIDKALLRPGRLDKLIYVPLPDSSSRYKIFEIKLTKMPVENIDIEALVKLTEGYSGAEIQAVCHEAAMAALTTDIKATEIKYWHFIEALKKVSPRTPKDLLELYKNFQRN